MDKDTVMRMLGEPGLGRPACGLVQVGRTARGFTVRAANTDDHGVLARIDDRLRKVFAGVEGVEVAAPVGRAKAQAV